MNRDLMIKLSRILNWVTAGLMLLLLVTFALPYFNYEGGEKSVISMWGYLGFPSSFEQMEDLMDVNFLSIKELNVVLGLIVVGIISIVTLPRKKGIATQLFPLIWCVWGVVGYFVSDFILLGNTFAYYVHLAILIITTLVVIFKIVLYIRELATRPESDYMDLDAWS